MKAASKVLFKYKILLFGGLERGQGPKGEADRLFLNWGAYHFLVSFFPVFLDAECVYLFTAYRFLIYVILSLRFLVNYCFPVTVSLRHFPLFRILPHHFKSHKLYGPHFMPVPYLFNKSPVVGHLSYSLLVIPFWVYLDGQILQFCPNVFLLQNFVSLFHCSGVRFVVQLQV